MTSLPKWIGRLIAAPTEDDPARVLRDKDAQVERVRREFEQLDHEVWMAEIALQARGKLPPRATG